MIKPKRSNSTNNFISLGNTSKGMTNKLVNY